ncbi:MAG TPA: hypothetical protein VL403_03580, partial [Candidatus Kryptonia bacterium]|nr:hypothetical protein [Candidatus Kryptonia bacterium]
PTAVRPASSAADAAPPTAPARAPAEETLLVAVMGLDRDVTAWVERRGVLGQFQTAELVAAAHTIAEAWRAGGDPSGVVDALPSAVASRITEGLLGEGPVAAVDRLKIAEDCAAKIEQRARRERTGVEKAKLRRAEEQGDTDQSREQLARLNRMLHGEGGNA